MIVAGRARHADADDDDAHEGRIGQRDAEAMKVIGGVKRQLVDAGLELVAGNQRLIGAAVGVRRDGRNRAGARRPSRGAARRRCRARACRG